MKQLIIIVLTLKGYCLLAIDATNVVLLQLKIGVRHQRIALLISFFCFD